jgi:hypothetical protein
VSSWQDRDTGTAAQTGRCHIKQPHPGFEARIHVHQSTAASTVSSLTAPDKPRDLREGLNLKLHRFKTQTGTIHTPCLKKCRLVRSDSYGTGIHPQKQVNHYRIADNNHFLELC